MKIADIRQKSEDELSEELLKLNKEAMNLRFQKASGQLENTAQIRKVRRTIARIKTVLKQRAANINVEVKAEAKKAPAKKAAAKKAPAKKATKKADAK